MLHQHTECVFLLCCGVIRQELKMSIAALIRQTEEPGFRRCQLYEIRELYKGNGQ